MQSTNKIRTYIYFITLFFIALSGFAQMPIFSRYYIADIPGLGWLGDFYINHRIHYIFAAIFTGVVIYNALDYFIGKTKYEKISQLKYAKAGIISGLLITGGLMMIKNLPGNYFSHEIIIFLNICHLGFCMLFLFWTVQEILWCKANKYK